MSPNQDDAGVWIHQDAWFHMSNLDAGKTVSYDLKNPKENGVYVFVLKGEVTLNAQALDTRDGIGIWDIDSLKIEAGTDTELLLMEVPMH